jgi:amidase
VSSWGKLTALQLVKMRESKELSASELVGGFVETIDRVNPIVHALVTLQIDSARERARAMDNGDVAPGLLWGLPFADKDLTHRAGLPTQAGSKLFRDAPAQKVSDPIPLALDRAGGISVGKSAVCEFGLTSYTESDVFPPTANPHALGIGAGGSSGGAAASVASGMLPLAPGSDGGGSVRIPAWTCGLVGIKPSRGLIPGNTGFDSLGGLVVPGPLARTVQDAALLLDALVGTSPTFRATHPGRPRGSFLTYATPQNDRLRVGVVTTSPWDDWVDISLDQEAERALQEVAVLASELGHQVDVFAWQPRAGYGQAFYTLWKASAVLLDIPPTSLHLLEPLTRFLVDQGENLQAKQLAGALGELSRFEATTIEAFSPYDVILTPGLALPPPAIGFYDKDDPERNFRQQVQVTPFSSFVNVCGLPALALPVTATTEGLPLGVQLVGRPGGDATLLSFGAELEAALGWNYNAGLL